MLARNEAEVFSRMVYVCTTFRAELLCEVDVVALSLQTEHKRTVSSMVNMAPSENERRRLSDTCMQRNSELNCIASSSPTPAKSFIFPVQDS